MDALRNKLILVLVLLSPLAMAFEEMDPECSNWGGVSPSQSLFFVDHKIDATPQNALMSRETDVESPTWIRVKYEDSHLQFENKTQGLGLPFTVYHMRAQWLLPDNTVLEESVTYFPEPSRCMALSLFPGQISTKIFVKRPDSSENLRLRVKVWSSYF